MTTKIGIIGLGKMGLPMAKHLLASAYEVHGYEVTASARDAASGAGVVLAQSPAELAGATDATLVIVGTDDQTRSVCLDSDGLLAGAAPGHALFICSTVHPDLSVEIAAAAEPRQVHVFDATLCRSEHAAHAAELLVLTAGQGDALARWQSMIETFATDVIHVGPIGAGQVAKMLNNYLLWVAVVANTEALRLGMRYGIDQQMLREAVLAGSGGNWALSTWNRTRPMPWAEKDLDILLDHARQAGLSVPMAEIALREITALKEDKAEPRRGVSHAGASMADYLTALEDAPSGADLRDDGSG